MEFILETLGKVGFDWRMGLFNFINFLIVFGLLKYFFFEPVLKAIKTRQEKINEGVEGLQKARTEVQMAEQKAQEIVDAAKVDANKLIALANERASGETVEMKERAKAEIEKLIAQAKKNIEIDKHEMQDALRKETVELIILALEKITGERLDAKKDEAYIGSIIASLK